MHHIFCVRAIKLCACAHPFFLYTLVVRVCGHTPSNVNGLFKTFMTQQYLECDMLHRIVVGEDMMAAMRSGEVADDFFISSNRRFTNL